jgi:hypothetical protein
VAAERGAVLLADDRDHRLVIEQRVVEAVQQVDRARPRRREADADLAGELRVRRRHERRHLLVADLHELRAVLRAPKRAHDSVDAIARVSEDAAHAPCAQTLDQEVADGAGHGLSFDGVEDCANVARCGARRRSAGNSG